MTTPKLDVPKVGDRDGLKKLDEMQVQLNAQIQRLKGFVDYERELLQALLVRTDERLIPVLGETRAHATRLEG